MKTTKEQVMKAAETSPEAKEALKGLFPEAFEPEFEAFERFEEFKSPYIARRHNGNLRGKGLHLDTSWSWSIAIDDRGCQVLQAVKKQR